MEVEVKKLIDHFLIVKWAFLNIGSILNLFKLKIL
jgi:hypothetical protein